MQRPRPEHGDLLAFVEGDAPVASGRRLALSAGLTPGPAGSGT
jgi:hypothetical protein